MKTKVVRAALAGAILVLPATTAFATEPIIGILIGIDHDPEGIIVKAATDRDGKVVFRDLAPGKYVLVIDGPGFVAAMDRLTAPPPKRSDSGFSIGVGGFFGGGSGHTSSTGGTPGGPAGGGAHSRGGGGLGLGVSIPVGGSSDHDSDTRSLPITRVVVGPAELTPEGMTEQSGDFLTVETPYCRDAALHGMRIEFSVPKGGDVRLEISDQASSGNLTSY